MTNGQDTNPTGQAQPGERPKDGAANTISSTSDKDALGEGSLDDVSGGAWPSSTTKTTVVPPTI
jgi:hypothetical protein